MRRIGYGLIGILMGIIIYILMLTRIPETAEVKSTLSEFGSVTNVEMDHEYQDENEDDYHEELNEDEYAENNQDNVQPFLQYGSYHVSVSDFKDYENKGIVKYGKVNPMFYFLRKVILPLEDLEDIPGLPGLPLDPTTEEPGPIIRPIPGGNNGSSEVMPPNNDGDNKTESYHMGFNIETGTEEAKEVSKILKSFKQYGRLPVDEKFYNVVSGFGSRIDPFQHVSAYHTGLDIANVGIDKSNVYATLHGEVSKVGSDPEGYGNYIVLEHDGFQTLYGHMNSAPLFNVGDKVYAGDILGYVGTTGRSTGPHVHYEVNIGNVSLNPALFISEFRK